MMGTYDDVVNNADTERWHNSTPARLDKQRELYPEMCHQLHKDPKKDQTFERVLSYIDGRLSSAPPCPFQMTAIKQGYLGEYIMSRSTQVLRLVIYLYIIVGVLTVVVNQNKVFMWRWLRTFFTYFHLK